ncbi:MAG: histidine phosphatase [Myxococcaceae bacterium]|jgi:phosphohistidine phosphatase|nr:histidine phosphatase [Myxococcaceae bacterium]
MRVFLVRHGDADADIPDGLDDEARALTARARTGLPAHFEPLVPLIGTPDVMVMSPLVRAVQTATILARALSYEGPMRATRLLFPDGPVGALEQLLGEHEGKAVVLVGHQPSMGAAAAHFLGMASFPKPVTPGTVIGIERPDGTGPGTLFLYAAPGQAIVRQLERES